MTRKSDKNKKILAGLAITAAVAVSGYFAARHIKKQYVVDLFTGIARLSKDQKSSLYKALKGLSNKEVMVFRDFIIDRAHFENNLFDEYGAMVNKIFLDAGLDFKVTKPTDV